MAEVCQKIRDRREKGFLGGDRGGWTSNAAKKVVLHGPGKSILRKGEIRTNRGGVNGDDKGHVDEENSSDTSTPSRRPCPK